MGTALRSLPSFRLAQVQFVGQGGPAWVFVRVEQVHDQFQAAAKEVAASWSTETYGPKVTAAIQRMLKRGLVHRAELLERQARGRWVEEQLRLRFPHLKWNRRGVDVTGPSGQKHHYPRGP